MGIINIYDLIISRYDLESFNKLPLKLGIKLILKSLEKEREKKYWDCWVQCYPYFSKDNFITFENFYIKQNYIKNKKVINKKTSREIIANHIDIMKKINAGQFKEVKI